MKFLAVIKDSFREATDSKVLYVMIAFSLVVILFVSSFTYKPLPAEDAFPAIVSDFHSTSLAGKRVTSHSFRVSDIHQTNEAAQPFLGEYSMTLQAFWNPLDLPEAEGLEYITKQFELHDIEVISIKPIPDKHTTYTIEAKGTGVGRSWLHQTRFFFGTVPWPIPGSLGLIVYNIENTLVNSFGGWFAVLVSVIITAFFVPNMLHKGSVDLLLSKPIGRIPLLLYKYIGGLTFMFVNSAVAVVGIWVVLGLRTGIWAPGFLVTLFVLTYFFAILYSISTLIGVLTRSAVISILITCLMWIVFFVTGQARVTLDILRKEPEMAKDIPNWLVTVVNVVHAVTPRTTDLDVLITKLLTRDLLSEGERRRNHVDKIPDFSWTETLLVSGLFIVVMLSLACWRFWARDY